MLYCCVKARNDVRIQTYALPATRCENVARRTATLEAAGDIDALSVQAHVTRRALVDICSYSESCVMLLFVPMVMS